jgi:hypothetical protein
MSIDSALICAKKWLLLTHSKTRCSRSLVTILHHHKSVVKKVNKSNTVENCSPRVHRHRASACSVNFLSLLTLDASEGANTSTLTPGKRRVIPTRECTKKIRTTWQSLNALPTTISFINKQTDSLNYVVDSVDKILISQLEPLPPSPGFSFDIYMTHPYG